jgi:hypothetical protein
MSFILTHFSHTWVASVSHFIVSEPSRIQHTFYLSLHFVMINLGCQLDLIERCLGNCKLVHV